MKPGSSDRCKSRETFALVEGLEAKVFHCNRREHKDDNHQAKHGKETLRWTSPVTLPAD